MTGFKELQLVKLRRALLVEAEMHNGRNVPKALSAGFAATIVDLNPSRPGLAYLESEDDDGNGFLFVVDVAELEAVEP